MHETTFCGDCGIEVDDDEPRGGRVSCRICGSRKRRFEVGVRLEIQLEVHQRRHSKHGRFRASRRWKPAREVWDGDSRTVATGRWALLFRLIDRLSNLYLERIVDRETGTVLREVVERLSDHTGRGSASGSGRKSQTD